MSPSLTADTSNPNPHEESALLLPWYVNGTLNLEETQQVEQYLDHYPAGRIELEQYRVFKAQIHEQPALAWQPPAGHLDRLMMEIDRLETPTVPQATLSSIWQRLLEWLRNTPDPVRWTLAAESLAVAALVLVVLLPSQPVVEPGFETLSSVATATQPTGPHLRVGFNPTLRISDLQSLLQKFNGQIVAGPSALGIYTLALDANDHPKATLDHALAVLRANRQVLLAEPQPNSQ